MLGRLGFVASVLTEGLTASRTCRLRNATGERIRALIDENLATLDEVVSFLDRHDIRLYRITSNLIPFASHPINSLRWWEDYADILSRLGSRMRRLGVRVSTHPGQYTVLNSPHDAIVTAATRELVYHARLLDGLGMDTTCKIVLHLGGLYGGAPQTAVDRFIRVAAALPESVRRRLVVENDDRLFDAQEVLQAGRAAGLPVVFDWLHHAANPCRAPIRDVLPAIFDTWSSADGRPKVHLSSQAAAGPAGAHADFVKPADVIAFMDEAPHRAFDGMLEAKQKDRAVLRLRRELARRGIVEADVRRASSGDALKFPEKAARRAKTG